MRDQARRTDPLAGLTLQERRILELIGAGLTSRQIGERMHLAEKTVKNYVSALFAKRVWNAGRRPPPTPPGSSVRTPALRRAGRITDPRAGRRRRMPRPDGRDKHGTRI
jgi:DNA-binding NarL/FixJ family response regulator